MTLVLFFAAWFAVAICTALLFGAVANLPKRGQGVDRMVSEENSERVHHLARPMKQRPTP